MEKRICQNCGKEFLVLPSKIKIGGGKFCSKKCFGEWTSKNKRGEKNPNWKGGIRESYINTKLKIGKNRGGEIGKAGKYLVCADLIFKGYIASIIGGSMPFDIILLTGKKIYKVQVKTSCNPFSPAHIGLKKHDKNDIDIFALVFYPTKTIGYFSYKEMLKYTLNKVCFIDKKISTFSKKYYEALENHVSLPKIKENK